MDFRWTPTSFQRQKAWPWRLDKPKFIVYLCIFNITLLSLNNTWTHPNQQMRVIHAYVLSKPLNAYNDRGILAFSESADTMWLHFHIDSIAPQGQTRHWNVPSDACGKDMMCVCVHGRTSAHTRVWHESSTSAKRHTFVPPTAWAADRRDDFSRSIDESLWMV